MIIEKPVAYHSNLLLPLNIQYFSDGEEDAILPDDYQEETPEQDDIQSEELGEDTTPPEAEEELTPEEQQQLFKLKYNHEELEIPYDEAVMLAQKGMNYDKVQERLNELESDPRLSFINTLAEQQGMTVDQFMSEYQSHLEQERINELVQQNIPEEYAKEMLDNRKFKEQWEAEQKQKEQEAKQTEEFHNFFQAFPGIDPKAIPDEVWQAQANGVPLKYAFMEHQYQQQQQELQVYKQNEANQKKAPVGSLSAHGGSDEAAEDDFLAGFNSID